MNVYRNIDRKQIQFDFLVWNGPNNDYEAEILELGGRIFHVPNPGRHLGSFSKAVLTLLNGERFSAVHAHVHHWNGIFLALAKASNVKVRVCHSHNTSDGRTKTLPRLLFNSLMRTAITSASTHLICPSTDAGECLFGKHRTRDSRFAILHNAIDLKRFEATESLAAIGNYPRLPANAFIVGHIGRFEKQKNHGFAISVFEAIKAMCPQACLLLAGAGRLEEQIKMQVAEAGLAESVYFLGARDDIPLLLKTMNIFLFPSLYEGLGVVVIEAQAAGVPVLSSDSVPREADLGIGLLKRLPLSATTEDWAGAAMRHSRSHVPAWPEREQALRNLGYDVRDVTEALRNVYGGTQVESR